MTKLEILQETYDYYSQDPSKRGLRKRSDGTGFCTYLNPETGNRCAVGRCLESYAPTRCGFDALGYNAMYDLEDNLQHQYRGHPIEFWKDLQMFHDDPSNWDSEGITQLGNHSYDVLFFKYRV